MSTPPPPSPLVDFSNLDTDIGMALWILASFIIYFIIVYDKCKSHNNGHRDIERGVPPPPPPPRTVVRPPDAAAERHSGGVRQPPASMAVISTRLFQYGEREFEGKNVDCSICLDEFREGEVCRMLPKCKHVFHQFCIDQWLPDERRCPVCRSPVLVRAVYHRPF